MQTSSTQRQVSLAIIGSGRIGAVHAGNILNNPRAKVEWVYDLYRESAQKMSAKTGAKVADSLDTIFSDDSVQGVIVGTPVATHLEMIERSARTSKAVLCEKPLSETAGKADSCWEKIKDLKPVVVIGFNRRFDPSFRAAHDKMIRGDIGRINQLTIVSRDPEAPTEKYLEASATFYHDTAVHDFDLARFFLGDIEEIFTMGTGPEGGPPNNLAKIFFASTILRSSKGVLCQIINSRTCAYGYDQRLEAFGTKGALSVQNRRGTSVEFSSSNKTDSRDSFMFFFQERYAQAYALEMEHFIDCIQGKSSPEITFKDGREAVALADAAVESHKTGHPVKLQHIV